MVLCPFVYLLIRHDVTPLILQPEEVHSAHWVPIRALLSPTFKAFERCDVSDRFVLRRSRVAKLLIRASAGQMLFSAVHLSPSESLYSDSATMAASRAESITGWLAAQETRPGHPPPLLLWGLTLGIVADLLEHLDREGTARLWSWPTFSHWDIRAIVWLATYKFRSRRVQELSGLDNTTLTTSILLQSKVSKASLAGAHLLDGYFQRMRKAVVVAFSVRLGTATFVVLLLVRRYRLLGK